MIPSLCHFTTATATEARRIRLTAAVATPPPTTMPLLQPQEVQRKRRGTIIRSTTMTKTRKTPPTTGRLPIMSSLLLIMVLNLVTVVVVQGQQLEYVTYDFTGEMELAPIAASDNDLSVWTLEEWNDVSSTFFRSFFTNDLDEIMEALDVTNLEADFIATDSIIRQINSQSQEVTISFQAQISYLTSRQWNWDPAELILDVYDSDESFTNFVLTYRNSPIDEFQDVNSIGLRTQLPSIRNSVPYVVVEPTCIPRLAVCEGVAGECCDGYVCREYLAGQPKICRDDDTVETEEPTTPSPTPRPTPSPTTSEPTKEPTGSPTTVEPTSSPTNRPTTPSPTPSPTPEPTTPSPTTAEPTTLAPIEPGTTPAPTVPPVVTPSPTANPTPSAPAPPVLVTNPSDDDDDGDGDGDGGTTTTNPSPTPSPIAPTDTGVSASESGDDDGGGGGGGDDDNTGGTTSSDNGNDNVSSSLRGQGEYEEPKKEITGIVGGIIIVGAFVVILIMGACIGYYYYKTKHGGAGDGKSSTEKNHSPGGFSAAASGNGLKPIQTGGIAYEEAYTNNFEIVVTPKTEADDDISELAGPFYPQDCDALDDEEKTYADKTVTDVSQTTQFRELLCGGTREQHPGEPGGPSSELQPPHLAVSPREQRIEKPMKSLLNLGETGFGAFGFGGGGKDTASNDDDNIFL